MRKHILVTALTGLLFMGVPSDVFAIEEACVPAQDAVDNGIADLISDAVEGAAGCSPAGTYGEDKFAISAGQLADRAIAKRNCMNKDFSKRKSCNGCFQSAKALLRIRFDGDLFHGLLANAVSLIEAQRLEKCSAIGQ